MKRITFILSLSVMILAAFVLSACGGESTTPTPVETDTVEENSYVDITVSQFKEMFDNEDFLLVNVHIPYAGEIPETDLQIPFDQMEQNLARLPEDKETKIVLYCRSGSMSATSARTLASLGFTNVWNLEGGMVEWEKQGYELIDNEPSTSQPRIYFDEDFVDIGNVPLGESMDYTFHFENVGNGPLIIEDTSLRVIQGC